MTLDTHSRSGVDVKRRRFNPQSSGFERAEFPAIDSEVITNPEGRALSLKDPIDRLGALLGVSENKITTVSLPPNWIHATIVVAKERIQDLESFLANSSYVMPSNRLVALEEGGNYRLDVLCSNAVALNYVANAFSALVCPSQTNEARTGIFIPGSGFVNKGRTVNRSIAANKKNEVGEVLALSSVGTSMSPAKRAIEVTLDNLNATPDFASTTPEPVTSEAVKNALKQERTYKPPVNRNSEYKLIPLNHPNFDEIIEDLNNRLVGNQTYCGQLGDYLVVGDCSEQNATLDISRAKNEHNKIKAGQNPKNAKIFVNRGQIEKFSRQGALRKVGNLNLRDLGTFDGMQSTDGKPFVALGGALNHLLTHEELGRAEIAERERKKYGTVKTQKMPNGLSVVTDVNLEYFEDKSELVGEEAEAAIQSVVKAFEDPKVEVIYITGDAGLGKTTLMQHALRRMGRIAGTMVGIEADQFVPGENISRIVRGPAERAEKQFGRNNPNFRALFQLVYGDEKKTKSAAALRTELTDTTSQAKALNIVAYACKAMGIDVAIDDWHFLGTDTQAVEKFYEALGRINLGRKKVIVSRYPDSEYALKLEERNPHAVARIKAPGVTYNRQNAVDHLEKCLGVKLNGENGSKLVVDGAQALRIGAVSFGNPLYFKSIVASLIDQNAYKTEGGVFKINEDFLMDIEAQLTTADDHAVFAANRVASLDRHPMGEGARDFVQAVAILGRLQTKSASQLITKVCPQAVGSEAELLTSLTMGLHLREAADPVTGEMYYVPYHNRIGTIVRSQIDVKSRLQLQKMLDDTFGESLDVDTRFKLQMNIINDVDIKTFVTALNKPTDEKNAEVLAFVNKFFSETYARYGEDMRGRNAVEVTKATAQKILELPVMRAIDSMLGKSEPAAIENAKKLIAHNPHIQTLVTALESALFDTAEAAGTQGNKVEADKALAQLKKLAENFSIDEQRLAFANFNSHFHHSDVQKSFNDTHAAYETLFTLSETKLREIQTAIAQSTDGSPEHADLTYEAGKIVTQLALAAQCLAFRATRNRQLKEDEKAKLIAQLNVIITASTETIAQFNSEHAIRNHGIPSHHVIEFLRIRDVLTPLGTLSEKLEKPNEKLGVGISAGGVALGKSRDSFLAESCHVIEANTQVDAENIADRAHELLAIAAEKPTAMPPQTKTRTLDTLVRMNKYLGKFDDARVTAQQGLDLALNTGNYNAALTCLSLITHSLRLNGTTQKTESGTLAPRSNTQLDQILAACDIAFSKEARMIRENLPPPSFLRFFLNSTCLEATADISDSNITATAMQASVTYTRADAAKIAEAKLNLNRVRGHLENACTTMDGAFGYGFGEATDISTDIRAGECQSFVIPAFAEVCALIRTFNTDSDIRALHYKPIDYLSLLKKSPLLTPENILAAALYHGQAEHKDPAFADDYDKRTDALSALLKESILASSDLTKLLTVVENTALRYDLNENGERNPEGSEPNVYTLNEGNTITYFPQSDLISMHSPFAVSTHNRPLLLQIQNRAAQLAQENPRDGSHALAYVRATSLLGDIEAANAYLTANAELCANTDASQYLSLQARVNLLKAKTANTENGALDIKRTIDFNPDELYLAFKAAEALDTFRTVTRTGAGNKETATTTIEIEEDVEAMLLQLDAAASLSRKIIKILRKNQLVSTLQAISEKKENIDIKKQAQFIASIINNGRGKGAEKKCDREGVAQVLGLLYSGKPLVISDDLNFTRDELAFALQSVSLPSDALEELLYAETGSSSQELGIDPIAVANHLTNEGNKREKPPVEMLNRIKSAPLQNDNEVSKLDAFIEKPILIEMIKSATENIKRIDAYIAAQKKTDSPMNDVQRNFSIGFARASWNFIEQLVELIPAAEKEHLGLSLDKGALDVFNDNELGAPYSSRQIFVNCNTRSSEYTNDVTLRGG